MTKVKTRNGTGDSRPPRPPIPKYMVGDIVQLDASYDWRVGTITGARWQDNPQIDGVTVSGLATWLYEIAGTTYAAEQGQIIRCLHREHDIEY